MATRRIRDIPQREIVTTYWEVLPHKRTFEKLADELGLPQNKNTWNELSKVIQAWEAQRRVDHRVLPENLETMYLYRSTELEDRLRKNFKLRGAVIVQTSKLAEQVNPRKDSSDWDKFDDMIHARLGDWAKRVWIALLRPNDIVGVAGGRGPYYTAKDAAIPHKVQTYFVKKVVALGGRFVTDRDMARQFDADDIAYSLVPGLDVEEPPTTVGSITKGKRPKPSGVTMALIGIGALTDSHRLFKYSDSQDLAQVRGLIEELKKRILELDPPLNGAHPPFHHCVGDMAHYFFVTRNPDPNHSKQKTEAFKRLDELVGKLNHALHNIKTEQLSSICKAGAVVAVAGGPHKGAAIEWALRPELRSPRMSQEILVTHLITDDICARYLLRKTAWPAQPWE